MMKREMKLGVGIAALCLALFMLVLGVGKANPYEDSELPTEGSEQLSESVENTESTEVAGSETEGTEESEEGLTNEYISFAIADVISYVNVRQEPNTECDIIGKIYDGAVAQILEVVGEGENQWFRIVSGSVEGYIKAEFFIHGEAAAAVMDEYVVQYARVDVEVLNVREGQSTDTDRIGYVCAEERLKVIENCGEWIKIQYTDEIEGYVFAEYVTVVEEYAYAKSPEEEQKEWDFIAELEERAGINQDVVVENTTVIQPPAPSYSTNSELRQQIVDYAMQFLGDPYIHGGQSLETGTDCSGFTMYVLAEFGYSISRTPQGQYTGAGRSVSYSEVQLGDIICYSENGTTCSHVAFYIGDGKILHAANPQDGVKISSATYTYVFDVRNVID